MGNTLDELFIMDTFTTLEAILLQLRKTLKTGSTIDDWDEKCLYAEKALCLKSRYQLSDRCCLAASTTVDEADAEHLPPEIESLGLGLYCYGRDLVDVVSAAVEQRPSASVHELLQALNYHNINDSFIDFSEMKKRPKKWNIGIFPHFSASQLKQELTVRESDVLTKGHFLEYPAGSVMIESGDSEIISLCNLISYQSGWALYLCISLPSAEQTGHWSQMLYQKYLISPIANPEDSKMKQPRLIANVDALSQAFPGTEPSILAQYFQSDFKVTDSQRRWEQYMVRRHKQKGWQPPEPCPAHYICTEDQYTSDDYRQVFDLLRYLSFPLEDEIDGMS